MENEDLFFSWNDVPTEEHKAAMTSYIDQFLHQGQSYKSMHLSALSLPLVIRTVFPSFFHLLVHPPSFLSLFISHSLTDVDAVVISQEMLNASSQNYGERKSSQIFGEKKSRQNHGEVVSILEALNIVKSTLISPLQAFLR